MWHWWCWKGVSFYFVAIELLRNSLLLWIFLIPLKVLVQSSCRNETKQNETKRNKKKQNKMKRNENETKRNETKRYETKEIGFARWARALSWPNGQHRISPSRSILDQVWRHQGGMAGVWCDCGGALNTLHYWGTSVETLVVAPLNVQVISQRWIYGESVSSKQRFLQASLRSVLPLPGKRGILRPTLPRRRSIRPYQ